MTRRNQFVVSVADRPGLLEKLVSRLWENGAKIREFEAVVDEGRVAVHLTVDEPALVREILAENGRHGTANEVAPDVAPRLLRKVARRLKQHLRAHSQCGKKVMRGGRS